MGKKLTHDEFVQKVFEKNEHVRNGEIEIRGKYITSQERIECYCKKHNVLWEPIAASLYNNIGCKKCAKEGISEKNSMTHEEFVDNMSVLHAGIKVLTQYEGMEKDITVELKCGHTWTTKAAYIYYKNFKCPYCTGNAILVGFNDLWTTAPDTAKLLTNPDDGYLISKGSGQKKNFTCPLCGKAQDKFVKNVVNRGLQCIYCGDGVSYPNKFARAFLDQMLKGAYIPEYSPEWAKPYFFDNAFEYNGQWFLLEMDGNFHYNETGYVDSTLEERQKVDKIKDTLAQEHNMAMIRIDCCKSDLSYIKNNILNSSLNNVFDLTNVDWQKCDEQAQKNLIKEACELYMSGVKSTEEIGKIIHAGRSTTIRYLKKGAEFGWCDYDPKKAQENNYLRQRKPVTVVHIKSQNRLCFDSIIACERELSNTYSARIYQKGITKACHTGESYNGFYFTFTD